jgi:hypothetical protein
MTTGSPTGLEFGYQFDPPAPANPLAYRKLTVTLRDKPSERPYDPARVEFPAVNRQGDLEALTIFHPWPQSEERRVVVGRIVMLDHKGENVEAFSFGGTLRLDAGPDRLVAVLESPAPVLALQLAHPALTRLAAEMEVLIARRRADWDTRGHPETFEARLAAAEPWALFQACLLALHQAPGPGTLPAGQAQRELEHLIKAELRQPADSAGLEALL